MRTVVLLKTGQASSQIFDTLHDALEARENISVLTDIICAPSGTEPEGSIIEKIEDLRETLTHADSVYFVYSGNELDDILLGVLICHGHTSVRVYVDPFTTSDGTEVPKSIRQLMLYLEHRE